MVYVKHFPKKNLPVLFSRNLLMQYKNGKEINSRSINKIHLENFILLGISRNSGDFCYIFKQ